MSDQIFLDMTLLVDDSQAKEKIDAFAKKYQKITYEMDFDTKSGEAITRITGQIQDHMGTVKKEVLDLNKGLDNTARTLTVNKTASEAFRDSWDKARGSVSDTLKYVKEMQSSMGSGKLKSFGLSDGLLKSEKELKSIIATFNALNKDLSKPGRDKELKKLAERFKEVKKEIDDVNKSYKQKNALNDSLKETEKKLITIMDRLKEVNSEANKTQIKGAGLDGDIKGQETKALELAKRLKEVDLSAEGAKKEIVELLKEINTLDKSVIKTSNALDKQLGDSLEKAKVSAKSYAQTLREYVNKNQNLIPQPLQEKAIGSAQLLESDLGTVKEFNAELLKARGIMVDLRGEKIIGEEDRGFFGTAFQRFKEFAPLSLSMSLTYKAMNLMMKAFGESIKIVKETDKALTELRKVTSGTEQTYKSFTKTAFDSGRALGQSGVAVINATADFARMGYGLEHSLGLAEQALLMLNVGDGIENIEDATKSLVATLKAYNVSAEETIAQAKKINDVYNEVSNNFAIDTADLADGIRRSATVLNSTGNSFEETVAMLTGINEIMQNIEKSSSGLNIISQRVAGIRMDKKTGELVPQLENALSLAGVELLDFNGELRSTYDILKDLSLSWDTLDTKTRAYLGEQLAGKRQRVVLDSLMTNFEQTEKALETALNSQGSAMLENLKYLDSIEGRIAKLNATLGSIANSIPLQALLSGVITLTDGLLTLLDTLLNLDKVKLRGLKKEIADINMMLDKATVAQRFADTFKELTSKGNLNAEELEELKNSVSDLVDIYPELASVLYDTNIPYEERARLLQELIDKQVELANAEKDRFIDSGKDDAKNIQDTIDTLEKRRSALQEDYRRRAETNPIYAGSVGESQQKLTLVEINALEAKIETLKKELSELSGDGFNDLKDDFEELGGEFDLASEKIKAMSGDFQALLAIGNMSSSDENAFKAFKELLDIMDLTDEEIETLQESFPGLMKEFGNVDGLKNLNEELQELSGTLSFLQSTLDEYNKKGSISIETFLALADKYPDLAKHAMFEGEKIVLTTGFMDAMVGMERDLVDQAKELSDNLRSEKDGFEESTNAIKENVDAKNELKDAQDGLNKSMSSTPSGKNDLSAGKASSAKKEFDQAKTSAVEYFKAINEGSNNLGKTYLFKMTRESGITMALQKAIDGFEKLEKQYVAGKVSSKEYGEAMADMNQLFLNAHIALQDLEKSQGVWKDAKGDVNNYANNLERAIKNLESYKTINELFDPNSDVMKQFSSGGKINVGKMDIGTSDVKAFQEEFIKTMEEMKRVNQREWNAIVNDISKATGKSKKETKEDLLDINSSLYKNNSEFNKTINTVISKTQTNIKNLGNSVKNVIADINRELRGLNISTNITTTKTGMGSYNVTVGGTSSPTARSSPGVTDFNPQQKAIKLTEKLLTAEEKVRQARIEGRMVEIEHNKKLKAELEKQAELQKKRDEISNTKLGQNEFWGSREATEERLSQEKEIQMADRYAKYNALLSHNNSLIEKNTRLLNDSTKSVKEQADAVQKEVQLKRRQQEILYMTNQARRAEREELEKLLKTEGFTFSGVGDDRLITNLDNINGKTKKVEEAMNRWIALQMSEIPKASSEWWDLEKAIKGVANALEVKLSQIQLFLTSVSVEKSNLELALKFADLTLTKQKKLSEGNLGADFSGVVKAETAKLQIMSDLSTLALEENMLLEQQLESTLKKANDLKNVLYGFGASFNGDVLSNEVALSNRSDFGSIKPFIDEYNELALTTLPNVRKQINENKYSVQDLTHKMDELVESSRKLAQEKEMERLNKQLQEYKDNLSALADLQEKVVQIIRKRGEEEKKALDETHKRELDQYKERHDIRIKGYKDELDEFNKMIKGKLEALDEQYASDDFAEQLRKETEKENEIKRQIAIKSVDDSLTARTQVVQLEKDLAAQSEKIADLKEKRERTLRKDNLNAQLKDKESNTNGKIDLETKYYNESLKQMQDMNQREKEDLEERYQNHNVYLEARKAIESGYVLSFDGNMKDLKTAYMDFEDRFGQGMGILRDRIELDFVGGISKAMDALRQLATVGIQEMTRMAYTIDEVMPANWTDPRDGLVQRQPESRMGGNNPFNMTDSDWRTYMANKLAYEDMARTGQLDHAQLNEWNGQNISLRRKYGIDGDNYSYSQLKQMEQEMARNFTPSTTIDYSQPSFYSPYSSNVNIGTQRYEDIGRQPYDYTPEEYRGQSQYGDFGGSGRSSQLQSMVNAMLAQRGDTYDINRRTQDGYADCSSAVWKSVVDSGLVPPDTGAFSTRSMIGVLTKNNFYDLGNVPFGELQYGDILVKPGLGDGHTEIYVGDGRTFGALGEGKSVDFRSSGWKNYTNVLRLKGYSDGGKVDYTGIAMLHGSPNEPEWIFNNDQFKALAKLIVEYEGNSARIPSIPVTGQRVAVGITIDRLINIEGNANKESIPEIQKAGENVLDVLTAQLKKNGISTNFKG